MAQIWDWNYEFPFDEDTRLLPIEPEVGGGWVEYFANFRGYLCNLGYIESGSISFGDWGLSRGTIVIYTEPVIGQSIQVYKLSDYDITTVFTGIVSDYTKNIATNSYTVYIADPVSAQSFNGVLYTETNPVLILQEIIESFGGVFQTDVVSDAEFYHTGEKVDFTLLIKSICLALSAHLCYDADGVYHLRSDDDYNSHELGTSNVFGDNSPNSKLNVSDYKNKIIAKVDDEWEEPYDEEIHDQTVETMTVLGLEVTVTRKGSQQISIVYEDTVTGSIKTEEWTYDEDGYVLTYTVEEETPEDVKTVKTVEYTDITSDNIYSYTATERHYSWQDTRTLVTPEHLEDDPSLFMGWVEQNNVIATANVNLDEAATVVITEQESVIDWYMDGSNVCNDRVLRNTYKTEYRFAFPGADALIKERGLYEKFHWNCHYKTAYDYVHNNETWEWDKCESGIADSGLLEKLEKIPAMIKHSVHMQVIASDSDSVALLGEIEEELTLIGINDIELLKTAAVNWLRRRAQVKFIQMSTPLNPEVLNRDMAFWNYESYYVSKFTHTVGNNDTALTCNRVSTLNNIAVSLSVVQNDTLKFIIKGIKKNNENINNITRGKIVTVIDSETYEVDIQ